MKSAQQLAQQAINRKPEMSTHSEKPNLSSGTSKCSQETLNNAVMLWGRMQEVYGSKWNRDHGEMPPTDPQSLWMIAIGKQTRHRIQVAIGKSIRRHVTWPPTIPEFVALCDVDAEELGLPPADTAWIEAQKKANQTTKYSHQAIHEAVKRAGAYDIARATSQSDQKAMKAKFVSEYNSIAKAMASGTLMLESDRQHSPDKFIERKMVESSHQQLASLGEDPAKYSGIKGVEALEAMRKRLRMSN